MFGEVLPIAAETVQHEQSATAKKCKCKSKTFQRVKVQHEIAQSMKRVQHEKKNTK